LVVFNAVKTPFAKFIALFLAPMCLAAEYVSTEPIGFNKVTCLTNSDTIVGVPLRQQGSLRSLLTAVPTVNGDSAMLTLPAGSLTAGALTGHFLKFIDGDRDGRWYDIQTSSTGTANTASTVTISLNGDTLGAVTTGDQVLIAQYWTLDTLFPPAGATTAWTETPAGSGNWVPNGHAVVPSTSTLTDGRFTEILFYNIAAIGTNLPVSKFYFIHNGIWKLSGDANTNQGAVAFPPSAYFSIRHPSKIAHSTVFRPIGEVETGSFTLPLTTRTSGQQDTLIGLPRPIGITLDQLGLKGTAAFVNSTGTRTNQRRDQLLVFDNAQQLQNKSPAAIYFVHNSLWKLSGGGSTDRGGVVIPAGAAFVIRKYQTTDGFTSFWSNAPTY
jgi:hypothetical protein